MKRTLHAAALVLVVLVLAGCAKPAANGTPNQDRAPDQDESLFAPWSLQFSDCWGLEFFFEADAPSVQALLPAGYTASTSADRFQIPQAGPLPAPVAAHIALRFSQCAASDGDWSATRVNLAWVEAYLSSAAGHEDAGHVFSNIFLLQLFSDGLPDEVLTHLRQDGFPAQSASILLQAQHGEVSNGTGRLYLGNAGSIAELGSQGLQGERGHQVRNGTSVWWTNPNYVDTTQGAGVGYLEAADGGPLDGVTVGGQPALSTRPFNVLWDGREMDWVFGDADSDPTG